MDTFQANILLDILLLCLFSIGIALPLYHFIRKTHPELAWNHHGNISTSSFDTIDLLGIILASSLFMLNIVQIGQPTSADADKLETFTTLQKFFIGTFSQAVPVGIACAFLIPRMDVLETFGLKRPQIRKILKTSILGLLGIYILVAVTSLAITPLLESNLGKQELQAPVQMIIDAKRNNPALLVSLAILAVIVAPLCEEFVFRGYIYGTLKRFSCRFFAATASALFFAVVHTSLWSLAPLFIVGLCLALIYELSGSLWSSILTHALFNGVTTFYLIFFYNESSLPY